MKIIILLLRLRSRMETDCEGHLKLRQLPMIYVIKVTLQEALPLGFLQKCLFIQFEDVLCFVSIGKKKIYISDITFILFFLILADFIHFLYQLQIFHEAYHKEY